ncbi:MAG: SDR family oxidoreductase [Candidatus Nitrosopelagicus sp.]|nr:SDR family oxidoreductase [Candidatus Nitrosopelagicus sp.]
MKLKNKVVLITGGSRGIGKSIAELFVKEGAKVVLTSKNQKRLKDTANGMKNTIFFPGDIRNSKDVKRIVKSTIKKFGGIDILVNNAGILPKMKPIDKITDAEWDETIDVNLTGHFRFTREVIPHMKKNGGSIINISSDAGLKAFENFFADAYVSAKASIILLTKSWALQFAKDNIRVNCICSAVVDTDMTKNLWLKTRERRKITNKEHPLGRIGKTQDIASAALYFASNDSSWTTGAILPVDGGVSVK